MVPYFHSYHFRHGCLKWRLASVVSRNLVKKKLFISGINCGKCQRIVSNGVLCSYCDKWYHFSRCSQLDRKNIPKNEWCCEACSNLSIDDKYDKFSSFSWASLVHSLFDEIKSLKCVVSLLKDELHKFKVNNNNNNI